MPQLPILLIHGYSSEGPKSGPADIEAIYGSLPQALRDEYEGDGGVFELDVSRYLSLNDGVTIDDLALAMNRCLVEEFARLLQSRFHVVVHSTGALVVRNWLRLFSAKPSPIASVVYLAGANFGSGWAHVGRGQLAKWGRQIFENGADRGLRVLDALELGSSETIDLHLHFTRPGESLSADYQTNEAVIVGSQADVSWFPIPVRYAKEDGSDGVVRVSAADLNFGYLRFAPNAAARAATWDVGKAELEKHLDRAGERTVFYEVAQESRPDTPARPTVPLAIPYGCAHTGKELGIVAGTGPRPQVMTLIRLALDPDLRGTPALADEFRIATERTYERVLRTQQPKWFLKWVEEPRSQYDKHAQILFRVTDQNGRAVPNFDVFFDSVAGKRDASLPIGQLFQDHHRNEVSPNVIAFYLRTDRFDRDANDWVPQVPLVRGCYLEVTAVESATDEILYLPMRYEFTKDQLADWLRPHRTLVIDVQLQRLPSPRVFMIAKPR